MKKIFDGLTCGNDKVLCPTKPLAQEASHVFVQQTYFNSDKAPEMIKAHKVAALETAR